MTDQPPAEAAPPEPTAPGRTSADCLRHLRSRLSTDRAPSSGPEAPDTRRRREALVLQATRSLDDFEHFLALLGAYQDGDVPAQLSDSPTGAGDFAGADAEWDLADDRVVWSAEMFRIFGREQQLGPLRLDQLPTQVHPDDRRRLSELLTGALVDGKPINADFRVARPDGSMCPVHCSGEPVLEPDGAVRSIWLSLRDLGRPRPS